MQKKPVKKETERKGIRYTEKVKWLTNQIVLITININNPTKRRSCHSGLKTQNASLQCLQKTHFTLKIINRLKLKDGKRQIAKKANHKKVGKAIPISDKTNLRKL